MTIAFPLLVWSVYSVITGTGDDVRLDGRLGVVAILGSAPQLVRSRGVRPVDEGPRRRQGSHSAG